ncbi:hypothetical protein CON35_31570 [Bacillus cereus]|nr:hypothetical protein CON35_31570 [Bacillus cereus]
MSTANNADFSVAVLAQTAGQQPVPFDQINVLNGTAITYTAGTGLIGLTQPGTYLVNYSVVINLDSSLYVGLYLNGAGIPESYILYDNIAPHITLSQSLILNVTGTSNTLELRNNFQPGTNHREFANFTAIRIVKLT